MNNITDVLKEAAGDILTEEVLEQIETIFNEQVEEKATLRVEKALVEQDETHAEKLEKLLEAIDSDHTTKLEKIIEAIDQNHGQKLVAIVKKYESAINENADEFKNTLVESISTYLEEYLEEQVPQGKFLMSNSIEEIKNFILGDELTFLIIDIDDVEGLGAHLNSDYLSSASVKRIVCSGHFSAIDFKKHQISEDGADGYLKKPLGAKDILDLLEDFSHYYEEIHQTTEPLNVPSSEEESLDQEKQPFESKLNNQIQQKFDYVFEEKVEINIL